MEAPARAAASLPEVTPAPAATDSQPLRTYADPHTVAGRYRVRCRIGTGGMGVVYLVEDLRLHGRLCALKVLSPWGQPEVEMARFEREVRVACRLRSPHTVQVFDTGDLPDGRPFIIMEYVEGHTLGDLLDQVYAVPPIQALEIIECMLLSLEEAHARGVIHRDLKPDNVMIRRVDGRRILIQPVMQIKVLDFGIARDFNANLREQRILLPTWGAGLAGRRVPRPHAPHPPAAVQRGLAGAGHGPEARRLLPAHRRSRPHRSAPPLHALSLKKRLPLSPRRPRRGLRGTLPTQETARGSPCAPLSR